MLYFSAQLTLLHDSDTEVSLTAAAETVGAGRYAALTDRVKAAAVTATAKTAKIFVAFIESSVLKIK